MQWTWHILVGLLVTAQALAVALGPAVLCRPVEGTPRLEFAARACCPEDEADTEPVEQTSRCAADCTDVVVGSAVPKDRSSPRTGLADGVRALAGVCLPAVHWLAWSTQAMRPELSERWPPGRQAAELASVVILI